MFQLILCSQCSFMIFVIEQAVSWWSLSSDVAASIWKQLRWIQCYCVMSKQIAMMSKA